MGYPTPKPITVFASAARTATPTPTEVRIPGGPDGRGLYRGMCLVIDCTAITSTPSVVFAIETSTGPADAYTSVLTSAAITATGSTTLVVHPSVATERTNTHDQGPLESKWRITATHGDADSITYSVLAFPLG